MNRILMGLVAAVAVVAAGCNPFDSGGSGSSNGKPYAQLDWAANITGADFTEVGMPSPITRNEIYRLKKGEGTVYWETNAYGCCVVYYVDVLIEGGDADNDRLYSGYLDANTLYYDDTLVEKGTLLLGPPEDDPDTLGPLDD